MTDPISTDVFSTESSRHQDTSFFDTVYRAGTRRRRGKGQRRNNIIVVRNLRSMTLIASYPARQIQIIFRLLQSPAEFLMGFEIGSCAFSPDVWALPLPYNLVENLVDMARRSASYEYGLVKYGKRGYTAGTPALMRQRSSGNQ
ncbi:hypothetical protein BJ742DRAFT_298099 [Cladochytrium replicatum]|nr:hypothetical protein BJ742DRAFT_298099 [Cladochytrium replicatum]